MIEWKIEECMMKQNQLGLEEGWFERGLEELGVEVDVHVMVNGKRLSEEKHEWGSLNVHEDIINPFHLQPPRPTFQSNHPSTPPLPYEPPTQLYPSRSIFSTHNQKPSSNLNLIKPKQKSKSKIKRSTRAVEFKDQNSRMECMRDVLDFVWRDIRQTKEKREKEIIGKFEKVFRKKRNWGAVNMKNCGSFEQGEKLQSQINSLVSMAGRLTRPPTPNPLPHYKIRKIIKTQLQQSAPHPK